MIWFVVGLIFGATLAVVIISKDRSLVRVSDDEVIVKRPKDGLTLVAAHPDILRRLVMQKDDGSDIVEARSIYKKVKIENPK
jgi:hypothetical protein